MFYLRHIVIITMLFSGSGICSAGVYKYPVQPGSKEWKEAGSYTERVKLCSIPAGLLSEMPTADLLETVLDFPFISNLTLYDNINEGFESLASDFNGLRELVTRDDAPAVLLRKYRENDPAKNIYINTIYEIMLSRKEILGKMTNAEKKQALGYGIEKFKIKLDKKSYSDTFSYRSGGYLLAKIMDDLKVESFKSKIIEDDVLKKFIKNPAYMNRNTISTVLLEAVKYNNAYKQDDIQD